jgi:hypothetical protein
MDSVDPPAGNVNEFIYGRAEYMWNPHSGATRYRVTREDDKRIYFKRDAMVHPRRNGPTMYCDAGVRTTLDGHESPLPDKLRQKEFSISKKRFNGRKARRCTLRGQILHGSLEELMAGFNRDMDHAEARHRFWVRNQAADYAWAAENIDRLKREMVAAHPDKGGTSKRFREAHMAWNEARKTVSTQRRREGERA